MTNESFDIVIIGAGIVGLATAFKLSETKKFKILVIDKESDIATHQTGRNSGVIHSGVYYKIGSNKSNNCLNGYSQLISYLKENSINYKITGKLIVATEESELKELDRLKKNGLSVGLNISDRSQDDIKQIDKNLKALQALYVEETGLTDYKVVSQSFRERCKINGVKFLFNETVRTLESKNKYYSIKLSDKTVTTKYIINATGLQCDRVYEKLTNKKSPVYIIPFKGEYYKIDANSYSSDIPIYPVPNPNFPFLGVHLTRMIDGTLKVGPNAVLMLDRESYDSYKLNLSDISKIFFNKAIYSIGFKYRKEATKELLKHGSVKYFTDGVKKFWEKFDQSMIIGYTSGIRAQAAEGSKLLDDFRYEVFENQIHVLNAPSPAATSCLSIADSIINLLNTKIE